MRRSSLRTWLLLVSVLFAVLVVGGIAVTTYVVVSDGMSVVARDTAVRIAINTTEFVDEVAGRAESESWPTDETLDALDAVLGEGGLSEGEFALYDDQAEVVWSSTERAVFIDLDDARAATLETGETRESTVDEGGVLQGLVGPSQLGVPVVHVRVALPDETQAVLDVAYFPEREEAAIDSVRLPMFALALSATLIMVVLMQTSMSWVLRLVNELREAADSIDAGRLDVHLPEQGEHEIGDLARSINRLIDRLRRKSEAQTRFVADASHELATPVAGIRGYTNILRAWGAEDPDVRDEAISAIDRESRRMARLCSDLLALVRDERALEFKNVRFDMNARARETLAAAATRYIDKGLEFSGPVEGQLMMVGDPDRIEDAISILVDNAAKYTPEGGKVALATRRKRDVIIVEVSDTGIGIPEEDLPSIFDRFYRSDASRSKQTGGFGLGLPIAKSIVDAAGGEIEVQSREAEGSTFTLRLPRGRL